MRKILIVGAGQSGLQLAIGLRQQGYAVTVVTDRQPEEIASGRVMSGQCMFDGALEQERNLHLNLWQNSCPSIEGMEVALADGQGGRPVHWEARLNFYAQSVDQRVKIPAWMARLRALGGELTFQKANLDELESYTRRYDLVIVSTGRSALSRLFPRDDHRSPYDRPQRSFALAYVTGMKPRDGYSAMGVNLVPGIGEYSTFPALTTSGPCDIMVFEAVPGGPMDCWDTARTPAEHLARSLSILRRFLPWEAERCHGVALTDDNGVLTGRVTPTVRKPVGILPSGASVLGLGDAVVLNDPITGQGASNAARCASIYLASILGREGQPFDAGWMTNTFERYWRFAQYVTTWTNVMLAPPKPHVQEILTAGARIPNVARRFVNGFDDPVDFQDWVLEPAGARSYLAREAV